MSIPKVIRLMDIQDIIVKNNPKANIEKLHKGYVYAAQQHRGQLRQSGEAYLSHPLNVAYILAEMNMDMDSIVAGLLHDTIEDTDATFELIADMFGNDVAFLVDSVSKISKIPFQSKEEKQAESFRKMLISMSDDVRVIIIKLADRLHNMRTLDSLREEKQRRIARETMDIYAPLAHRLGISWIKWELEDRSFRILNPEEYYEIHQKVKMKRTEREQYLNEVMDIAKTAVERSDIKCNITGRPKHFYSIYSKMLTKQTTFEEIYDLLALRIIVDDKADCYSVLGIIHSLWTPIPYKIKDYIANPKANMYQSIHTTVMGPGAMMVEFQIRTWEMHKIAEEGIAAHWRYKEGKVFNPKEDKRFVWLRKILEDDIRNQAPTDFVNTIKEDVLQKQIYVFTPRGHVVELPEGSTPIDFAFAIHSEVGCHCVGAKVNGRIVPLKSVLKSGDKLEILTSQTQEPKKDWLAIVKTSRAKSRINAYLRKKNMEMAILTGKELLSKEFKAVGLDYEKVLQDEKNLKKALEKFVQRSLDDLIANVGFGQISPRKLLHLFDNSVEEKPHSETSKPVKPRKSEPFTISGINNMMIKTAKCCCPLPGDDVLGYISVGRGIVVHKADCPNLKRLSLNEDRIVEVVWDDTKSYSAPVKYTTFVQDKPGMFIAISTIIKDMGLNIYEMNVKNNGAGIANMDFVVWVENKAQADKLTEKIRSEKGVISVSQQ
ncbi:MAG: bifunctional (p)ppGpp synthetase/guanosine-3',5'-bis(diphosphate) 3'-pyrophosphohydrolase [Deferribacterales bacterium]|nr:bifunctional (p)ppGpp synthetase/guanosine-3',5'-bis(diphosphate) 3'-pyrophosphohydrolase [Deferribacterales bacterium]